MRLTPDSCVFPPARSPYERLTNDQDFGLAGSLEQEFTMTNMPTQDQPLAERVLQLLADELRDVAARKADADRSPMRKRLDAAAVRTAALRDTVWSSVRTTVQNRPNFEDLKTSFRKSARHDWQLGRVHSRRLRRRMTARVGEVLALSLSFAAAIIQDLRVPAS